MFDMFQCNLTTWPITLREYSFFFENMFNHYPVKMIDEVFKSYLNGKMNCKNKQSSQNTESGINL